MFVLGLTGGIGSGKSTAAEFLKDKGFVHIDADQIGRDLTADGSPFLEVIRDAFGKLAVCGGAWECQNVQRGNIGNLAARKETGADSLSPDDGKESTASADCLSNQCDAEPAATAIDSIIQFRTGVPGNGLTMNRQAMAELVFNNPDILAKYNDLMFTAIAEEIRSRIAAHSAYQSTSGGLKSAGESANQSEGRNFKTGGDSKPDGIPAGILIDAPLLFEAGADCLCDKIVLITADEETRIARVCARDGASPETVRARIRNQMSEADKAAKSDYIIDNSGDIQTLHRQIDQALGMI